MSVMSKEFENTDTYYEENGEESNEASVALFISIPTVIMGLALMFFILIDKLSTSLFV